MVLDLNVEVVLDLNKENFLHRFSVSEVHVLENLKTKNMLFLNIYF